MKDDEMHGDATLEVAKLRQERELREKELDQDRLHLVFLSDAGLIKRPSDKIKELREKAGDHLPGFEPSVSTFTEAVTRANETWMLVGADTVSVVNPKEASCLRQLSNTKRGLNELKPLTGHK